MTDAEKRLLQAGNRAVELQSRLYLTAASNEVIPNQFTQTVKVNLITLMQEESHSTGELELAANFLMDCLVAATEAPDGFDYFEPVLKMVQLICYDRWQDKGGKKTMAWLDQIVLDHLGDGQLAGLAGDRPPSFAKQYKHHQPRADAD